MPKPRLYKEDAELEVQIIETLKAGLQQWRPDLSYPESHSDMQACVRGLMQMFDITRRPLPKRLRIECGQCEGRGKFVILLAPHSYKEGACDKCEGKGYRHG